MIETRSVLGAILLCACSSAGGGPNGNLGGSAGAAGGAAFGGSGGTNTGGNGAANLGGNAGAITGGSAGSASGGSAGTASGGNGGGGGVPGDPGCAPWLAACGGAACSTSLHTDFACGSCNNACAGTTSCAGTLCLESATPDVVSDDTVYLSRARDALGVYALRKVDQKVVRIPASKGVAQEITAFPVGCEFKPELLSADDTALFALCKSGDVMRIDASGATALNAGISPAKTNTRAALGLTKTQLYWVGAQGVYRASKTGASPELWFKNLCVTSLHVAEDYVAMACVYDSTIRMRATNAPPSTAIIPDFVVNAKVTSNLSASATHFVFLDGQTLKRVPRTGGSVEDLAAPGGEAALSFDVDDGGVWVLRSIAATKKYARLDRTQGLSPTPVLDSIYDTSAQVVALPSEILLGGANVLRVPKPN